MKKRNCVFMIELAWSNGSYKPSAFRSTEKEARKFGRTLAFQLRKKYRIVRYVAEEGKR